MSSQTNEPAVTDHVYDGIQEYDNPLPGWWTMLFYLSILFSIGYTFINFAQPGWVETELRYAAAEAAETERMFADLGNLEADSATIHTFLADEEQLRWLNFGKALFATNCASCHGRDGSGNSGPNLTDDHYLHVRTLSDIPRVVTKGANGAAMPAWGNRLKKNEIVLVSAYVASLRGLDLPSAGGREAEGEVIEPWSAR